MRRLATLVAAAAFFADAGAEGLYSHLYEPGTLSVEEVIGMEVEASDGKPTGKVRDVLFDPATGRVEGVIVDTSGVIYPVEALVSSERAGRLIAQPVFEAASAGGSALQSTPQRAFSAARGLVIDLREGRIRPRP